MVSHLLKIARLAGAAASPASIFLPVSQLLELMHLAAAENPVAIFTSPYLTVLQLSGKKRFTTAVSAISPFPTASQLLAMERLNMTTLIPT